MGETYCSAGSASTISAGAAFRQSVALPCRVLVDRLLGNLTGQKVVSGAEALVDETYTYDAAGNRLSRTSNQADSRTTTYTYDVRSRLTGWQDATGIHTLEWDPAGNLTSRDGDQRTHDARNQLRSVGDRTYSYSADGNRIAAGTTTYDHDPFGQLTRSGTNSYQYDALGRLSSTGDKTLTYAGLERDASEIGSSPVVRDPRGRIIEIQGGRGITDPHGDVIAVLDGPTERVVSFDPLGQASSTGADQLGFPERLHPRRPRQHGRPLVRPGDRRVPDS
ncbi:RHS repeat domain-containing protein [Myceligenerans indicum]|uniref:RHS repeat protein n=1 Tax=Myceligenerans indicum TaxID=2593663 RepID=A0ABS1LRN6_9MICO|nr:RHS repeat domain-containing protein [Myceligenerans indicum]MBL0888875.1 RHS repeat protein [Myceligenerans indicum]